MTKILERYSGAVNSDNLASDPRTTFSDSDVLGAAGLAARYEPLGIALTRLFADGKPETALDILTEMAFKRARTIRVRLSQVEAGDLSRAVLGWYRHGVCQPCGGTAYQLIPGTPALGDECKHCRGTGRLLFDVQFMGDKQELAHWMAGEIDRAQAAAGSVAMTVLAPRLEL